MKAFLPGLTLVLKTATLCKNKNVLSNFNIKYTGMTSVVVTSKRLTCATLLLWLFISWF